MSYINLVRGQHQQTAALKKRVAELEELLGWCYDDFGSIGDLSTDAENLGWIEHRAYARMNEIGKVIHDGRTPPQEGLGTTQEGD